MYNNIARERYIERERERDETQNISIRTKLGNKLVFFCFQGEKRKEKILNSNCAIKVERDKCHLQMFLFSVEFFVCLKLQLSFFYY